MDSVDAEVLGTACNWAAAGQRFALISVARTWGSAPRPAGAWMVLSAEGQVHGSVSGGCIEDDLIRRITAGEFAATQIQLLQYGVSSDEARRFGLPCGGSLELVLEPQPDIASLQQLATGIAAGQLLRRELDSQSGVVRITAGDAGDKTQWDGRTLITPHGPAWRLLLIGAGQLSRFVAQMALALDYRVLVCDPRDSYYSGWDVAATQLLTSMPDDFIRAQSPDAHCAVVALTHDPKLDDLALLEALQSPAFYIGALGSQANSEKRRQRLQQHFAVDQARLARLRGPVGLAIGSRTPPEIAVAILAEMTATRHASPLADARRR